MSTSLPNPIDIRASADQVITYLQQGQHILAMNVLESHRAQQPIVVQEALDRYVVAGARTQLQSMEQMHRLGVRLGEPAGSLWPTTQTPTPAQTLERLLETRDMPPRMPQYSRTAADNELAGLSPAQQYDVYASIAEMRGNAASTQALQRNGESVLLGLRQENSTLVSADGQQRGTGIYNDQIVVLKRSANGERSIYITNRANTEPTAQYDHHAGSDGSRVVKATGKTAPKLAPSAGYERVIRPRDIEGHDVNQDGVRDMGRMAEGVFEMQTAKHANPSSAGTPDAFKPTLAAVAAGQGMIQRDTNGDGWFNENDINGIQNLNDTFKIHSGSRTNTDSAGCQTIHPDDYRDFMNAAKAHKGQTRWQYILTHVGEGPVQDQQLRQQNASPRPPLRMGAGQSGTQTNNTSAQNISRQQTQSSGPFNDPYLDKYFAAVMARDNKLADSVAIDFAQSPQGQAMAQQGQQLLAAQQAQQQQEQQAQTQQAPVMKI